MYKRTNYIVMFSAFLFICTVVTGLFGFYKMYRDSIWLDEFKILEKETSQYWPIGSYGTTPKTAKAIVQVGASYIDIGAKFGTASSAEIIGPKLVDILAKQGLANAEYKIYPSDGGAILYVTYSNAAFGKTESNLVVPVSSINKAFSEVADSVVLVRVPHYLISFTQNYPIRYKKTESWYYGAAFIENPKNSVKNLRADSGQLYVSGTLNNRPYWIMLLFYIAATLTPLGVAIWLPGFANKTTDKIEKKANFMSMIGLLMFIVFFITGLFSGAFNPNRYTNLAVDLWFGSWFVSYWAWVAVAAIPVGAYTIYGECVITISTLLRAESAFAETPHTPEMVNLKAWTIVVGRLIFWLISGISLLLIFQVSESKFFLMLSFTALIAVILVQILPDLYYDAKARALLVKSKLIDDEWLQNKQKELSSTVERLAFEMQRKPRRLVICYDSSDLTVPRVGEGFPGKIDVSFRAAKDFTDEEMEFLLCKELARPVQPWFAFICAMIVPLILLIPPVPSILWSALESNGNIWIMASVPILLVLVLLPLFGMIFVMIRRESQPDINRARIALQYTNNREAAASALMKLIDYQKTLLSEPDEKLDGFQELKDLGLEDMLQHRS